jgi:hypothetical protein
MNRPKNKLLIAGLMAITSGVFASSAVQANDLENLFRNVFGNNVNNGQAMTQNQLQTMTDLNNARARVESKIAAGLASGQISAQQSLDFRAELNQNAATQSTYTADGYFAYNEAQGLWNTLNNIESRVQSVLSVPIATGTVGFPYGYNNTVGYGFRPMWGRGYVRNTSNINRMQSDVLSMLERGRSNGFLTTGEYNSLKAEYDAIASREIQLRSDGLNFRERERLVNRLNSLANNISREINDRQVAGRPRRWW